MANDLGRLDSKIALITGAANGQGAAEARLFASLGASVIMTDIDDSAGQVIAEEIGEVASYHHHDVTSTADWNRVVAAAVSLHGRIDILVNNAGVYRTGDILEWPESDLRALIDVNLLGPVLGMRAVVPVMAEGSSIVNVASISGTRGHGGALPYSASKWGLRGASRSAAREFAPRGIRVNCVCPGSVDTPMISEIPRDLSHLPLPRRGTAEEVAATVAFLASDASSYTTGADFVVDGGATA